MGKIKVSLANGSVLEKPLVTCFQGGQGNYIILDNETNGSMGMPIVCISKFNNNRAEKIVDPNEWASVKESIKSIIAGTKLNYINVPDSIQATEDFYTQLTIPVDGFDLIKKSYVPETVAAPAAPVAQEAETLDSTPATSEIPSLEPIAPVMPETPIMEPQSFGSPTSLDQATTPVTSPVDMVSPVIPNTVPEINPLEPVAPTMTDPIDVTSVTPSTTTDLSDINAIKENFMKSCETMFEALLKQFNNK